MRCFMIAPTRSNVRLNQLPTLRTLYGSVMAAMSDSTRFVGVEMLSLPTRERHSHGERWASALCRRLLHFCTQNGRC
jgi:hypothetical protein